MRVGLRSAALVLLALLLPACGKFKGFFVPFPDTVAKGLLRGSQVVPAQGSGATGTATITVDGLRKFVDYDIDSTGLSGAATAVEIRLGVPGTNGPVLFNIPLGTFPLTGRLTTFTPQTTVTTFADAAEAIAQGNAYLLISTGAPAVGEIRAHLGKATLASAKLTGSQAVPAVGTTASGTATVVLNDAQDEFIVTLTVSNLTGITGAQIYDGAPLSSLTTPLFDVATASFTGTATATLGAGDFTASGTVTSFPEAINALLSGGLFLQVHATDEIRGQIGPTQLNAVLTGADVAPPVTTAASGSANITLNATQTALRVDLAHTVSGPTSVTIHAEDPAANGPQLFDVDAIFGTATSPLVTTLQASQLTINPPKGINDFPDCVNAALIGKTYIMVSSASFPYPGAEIRGQILP
ncbi:MAG: CHRD domain-containing protein [Planctomycetaceae bacterium]|nr:CHRD domain-containing protein [Planctomycetaceae bacterium]